MEENNMIIETTEVEVTENEATEVMEVEGGSKGNAALIGLVAVAGVGAVVGLGKKFIAPHFTAEAKKERLQRKLDKLEAKIAEEAEQDEADTEEKVKKGFIGKDIFKKKVNKKEETEEE